MGFWESNGFKYVKNLWIGVGAALIIIGALWKIMHWPNANEILTFAMFFEAAIFLVQAIIPPDKSYKWERVYPYLERNVYKKMQKEGSLPGTGGGSNALVNKLNNSLEQGNMDSAAIGNLGSHLKNLGDNINKLTTITDSAAATEEYSHQAKQAAQALSQVKDAYSNAVTSAQDLAGATEGTKQYHEQVQQISKNLAALNAVYELELQDTNNHLKAMNKFYGNLTNAIENLNESVDDTKLYKDQMATLNRNLSSLNGVYGSMLTAMSGNR